MPWWGWLLVAWPVVSVPVALLVAGTVRRRDGRAVPVAGRDGACGWGCASVHLRGWRPVPAEPPVRTAPVPDGRSAREVVARPGARR